MTTLPQLPSPTLDAAQAADLRRAVTALAEALAARPGLDVRHLRDFMTPITPGTARLAVRCDVSGDPAWTLPLARLAARHAVPATFFLSHREEYFGRDDGWLPAFLAAGPELGLKAVPWVAGDPDYAQAAPAVTAAIGWLRDRHVDLRGLAFDPPCFGIAAEGSELLRGHSLCGRTQVAAPDGGAIALQTLDPAILGIGYTTQFAPMRDQLDTALDGYFAVMLAAEYRSLALQQAMWGNNPLHNWRGFTTLTYVGNGGWLRYDGDTSSPPTTHWNVASLLEWIEQTGAGRRYQFILDPRLLGS